MSDQTGRNDPCHCGSGKKYKHCCFQKDAERKKNPLAGRKFTVKPVSKPTEEQQPQKKQPVDYAELMERAFGDALHKFEEQPPLPEDPTLYMKK